jgi:hypothetical protein
MLTAATSACALLTSTGRYRSCSPGPGTREELRRQAYPHGYPDRSLTSISQTGQAASDAGSLHRTQA